ncbi:hypothetical protein CHU98_g8881 [Xylaria longipes]|nr:hypothetical protein CHU98_g8881 [Xylaria longipes]
MGPKERVLLQHTKPNVADAACKPERRQPESHPGSIPRGTLAARLQCNVLAAQNVRVACVGEHKAILVRPLDDRRRYSSRIGMWVVTSTVRGRCVGMVTVYLLESLVQHGKTNTYLKLSSNVEAYDV